MPRSLAVRRFASFAALALAAVADSSRADTVYVTSFTTGALVRYDSVNPAGTATVLSGSGSMVKPAAMALGPDGNLYIGQDGDAASIAPQISRFDLTTNTLVPVYTFASFDVFPGSLLFKGNDLLVGRNPFFGNTGAIVKMTNITGGTVAVSDYTTGGDLASSPGLALAADGSLYVADQTYNFVTSLASGPVKRFDAAGTYVGEVIASGSASGLYGPTGLAINGSTLYTASIMDGSVLQTNLSTDVTQPFANAGGSFEVGALALLADGSLLAGSPSGYTGNIYRFGTNGALLETYSSGLGQIGGIVTVAVPEPGTLVLAGLGIAGFAGFAGFARNRRRSGNG
ncbi:MAG: PEP-CTERM sorting domain-containing protein [Planctomycetia bacterium]|nr:PEP-CTERM sorting domain-containing protein [Planctomycetia bacterium]